MIMDNKNVHRYLLVPFNLLQIYRTFAQKLVLG
jgi:hypothetical protein